ncbi:hypothetical protein AUQ39_09800 [Lacticaseibacillus casei]|uniref:Uncharacterized protein n=2 Tax=Lacticaseibacillus zeae TaxID=57037 RepID=A0A5R8LMR5_LACZE|nr:hypothetical protein [Lacticaseibacillus zeae]OLS06777.1 hypothetical protein AUQ39_09800 [Lacticaseibacillus casei]QVI32113.1 hypothetical protein KG087_00245 [Lacticaseibacillus zeae]TLF38546.1 hypothetical protein FEI14_14015 [Lacticaseibacillus zeae]
MKANIARMTQDQLASISGGRKIVGYVYQSGLGQVPIYDTDAKLMGVMYPKFFKGIFEEIFG